MILGSFEWLWQLIFFWDWASLILNRLQVGAFERHVENSLAKTTGHGGDPGGSHLATNPWERTHIAAIGEVNRQIPENLKAV